MPDGQEPAPPADGRRQPSWRTIGAVAGTVAALLIAVGAWLLPEPGKWVCDVSDGRGFGCNDVPSGYLGKWSGPETCHESLGFTCTEREFTLVLTIHRGRTGDEVVTSRSESEGKPLCESSWTLRKVGDEALEFHVERSRFVPAKDRDDTLTGCPGDLYVRLHLTEQHTLELETRSGDRTVPPLPGGILMFTGDLREQ